MLHYHHCISLENVVFGELKPDPKYSDKYLKKAYSWLEKQIGFYPLFLAVGTTEEGIRMTGYQNQWRKLISKSLKRREYRKAGQSPNYVLFSFENVAGIFMDYNNWHIVLNASHKNYQITNYEKKLIFKPSWPTSKWLKNAKKNPQSVQLVTPKLYLPDAKRLWVRNKKTKKILELIGFRGIEVKRILVDDY